MSKRKTFVDQLLSGDAMVEDADDFVEAWHDAGSGLAISEYLGMSEEEYLAWLEEPDLIRSILNARYRQIPFTNAVNELAMAARSADPKEANVLYEWLVRTKRIAPSA